MTGLRVLVVSDEMEVGGSQRQIVHLLRGLRERGADAALLYFRKPSFLLDAIRAAGVPVQRIDKRGAFDPVFVARLLRFMRRGRFDIVHCFSITAEIWVRFVLQAVPRTRLVSSIRGLDLGSPSWHWRAKRWIVRGSAAVISNSAAGADFVAGRTGTDRAAIDVVPNAVDIPAPCDPAARAALRASLQAHGQRPVAICVGRLIDGKGVDQILRAMADPTLPPDALLWVVGDGPLRAGLESLRGTLGLDDRVLFLGERDDVPDLMRAADLLVSASRGEGLSNVILEAMAAGLPVVATAVGGTPEVIEDGVSGRLVDPAASGELVHAIAGVLRDPALRSRLAAAARQAIERRFAAGVMVDRTLAVYRRCLAGGAR